MRILIVNYRYFLSGGPEKYMFGIKELLEKDGHYVIPFSVKSRANEDSRFSDHFADPIGGEDRVYFEDYGKDVKTAMQLIGRQFYSFHARRRLEKLIKETVPDVCYLLHHYNKLSPSVIDACRKHDIPVVMRVSDFFLLCANGLFFRDGEVCEECMEGSLISGIRNRCVKNSFLASLVKASAMKFHRITKVYENISRVIAPSSFTAEKISGIIESERVVHLPTFVSPKGKQKEAGEYLLFVGRIEKEKGIIDAIIAAKAAKMKLKIAGKSSTGYDREVMQFVHGNIYAEYLGQVYGERLSELYRGARAVIIPNLWYENMPNVALEAMAHGKPIVASDLGSMKEIVKDGYNGYLFPAHDAVLLKEKLLMLKDDEACMRMGENSYREAVERYSPKKHLSALLRIFEEALLEGQKWKH